jgi:hypothetical protein
MQMDVSPPPQAPAGLALLTAADLQDHLLVATNDLDRLQRLLDDACASLMLHFSGARENIAPLAAGEGSPDAAASAPQAAHAAFAAHAAHADYTATAAKAALVDLGQAITALQFGDLAAQLVDHTARRLRNCADRLAQDSFGNDEDGAAVVQALPLRPNPVTQDEMDAGSVELF